MDTPLIQSGISIKRPWALIGPLFFFRQAQNVDKKLGKITPDLNYAKHYLVVGSLRKRADDHNRR